MVWEVFCLVAAVQSTVVNVLTQPIKPAPVFALQGKQPSFLTCLPKKDKQVLPITYPLVDAR